MARVVSELEELLAKQIEEKHLPKPTREWPLVKERQMRIDFYWPTLNLAVEVHGGSGRGGRHGREPGMTVDCEKIALLYFLNNRYLQFTSRMVKDGRAIRVLEGVFHGFMPGFLLEKPMARRKPKTKKKGRR